MEIPEKNVHNENQRKVCTYKQLQVPQDYLTRKPNHATSHWSPARNQGGRVSGIDNVSMLTANTVAKGAVYGCKNLKSCVFSVTTF